MPFNTEILLTALKSTPLQTWSGEGASYSQKKVQVEDAELTWYRVDDQEGTYISLSLNWNQQLFTVSACRYTTPEQLIPKLLAKLQTVE